MLMVACSENEELGESIIPDYSRKLNPTEQWLNDNFTKPYNIEVKYRWDDGEVSSAFNLTPPREDLVVPFMQILDSIWVKPYIEVAGEDFFKKLAPKQFLLIGSASYNSNNTRTLGTADAGRKIVLYDINWIDPGLRPLNANDFPYKSFREFIIGEYIHVIFHEFAHILHQTIMYDPAFKNVISGYTASWTDFTDQQAREKGFISAYSMDNSNEDFVETVSLYIVYSKTEWDGIINSIQSTTGKQAIITKQQMMARYMKTAYNIDVDVLRTKVQTAIDRYVVGKN
jgi:substrate import-associated zinc metallohydrolase lipoprotein